MRGERGSGGEAGPSFRPVTEGLRETRFPPAAQPEIMRAAEKDDHYAAYVHDACRDAFRHLFGHISPPPSLWFDFAHYIAYRCSFVWLLLFRRKGCCCISKRGRPHY